MQSHNLNFSIWWLKDNFYDVSVFLQEKRVLFLTNAWKLLPNGGEKRPSILFFVYSFIGFCWEKFHEHNKVNPQILKARCVQNYHF